MTNEELCKNLRALSPGYSKMDGSYVEIGREAAELIERLVKELEYTKIACERLREDRDEVANEIERLTAITQSDAEPRGSESSAWAAFWISEAARGHKYESLQDGFNAGWRQSAETVARDNAYLRKSGTALAEAALRVIREYDGTHRLALAVAEWSKVVANEGGRAAIAQSGAQQILDGIDEALESRGYAHMANGKSIGELLDELEKLRTQSDAPPRPDASAELIEMAEIAEQQAAKTESAAQFALQNIATAIRIRAADRSGK